VGYPSRVSRAEGKGKAGPLEAGRGKYSPPANPEGVTSEGLKRRDNGFHVFKMKYTINSIGYKNMANKNQVTPGKMNCAVFWRMIVISRDYGGRRES